MPREPRHDFSRTDWMRADVGRVSVRTDATTRAEWRAYQKLLDLLYEEGQHDVLAALKGRPRALSLVDVKAEVARTGDLGVQNLMSRLILRRELWSVLGAAATRLGTKKGTRGRYGTTLVKLVKCGVVVPGKTLVRDLLTVDWRAVRLRWTVTKGYGPRAREVPASAADWNHLRRFLSSALTDLFGGGRTGQAHPFRRQVLDRFPSETEYEREVTLTLEQFTTLVAALPERIRPAVLALALTGMRLSEYLTLTRDALEPAVPGLRLMGKTGPGVVKIDPTLWPWIDVAVPSPVKSESGLRGPFKRAAAKVGHPGLRLHDLRHLNATAAMAAGAGLDVVRDQLRHADARTTMRYLKGANRERAAEMLAQAFAPVLKRVGGKGA